MVGTGDGKRGTNVGVGDNICSGVTDGTGAEVSVGSGVLDELGFGVSVGLVVLVDNGTGVPVGATPIQNGAAQAAREIITPRKRNAFLIVLFAFYDRRIVFAPQGVPRLWSRMKRRPVRENWDSPIPDSLRIVLVGGEFGRLAGFIGELHFIARPIKDRIPTVLRRQCVRILR